MTVNRRLFCQSIAPAILLASACRAQTTATVFRPEDFGARGDGVTNDTDAFAAMAARINAAGGGTIELNRKTYIIGRQAVPRDPRVEFAFAPAPLLEFRNCRTPLEIRGNGARLLGPSGLRYGTFDRASGTPTRNRLPFYGVHERATPYAAMIYIAGATDTVLIENLELDGNVGRQVIGGAWGDIGWQIPGAGIILADNRGSEILRNIRTHHHPTDGLTIDGVNEAPGPNVQRLVENVESTDNGRQGLSVIGGRGYVFRDCLFARSARGRVQTSPAAGVDIEAENGKLIRDLSFERCVFADNAGCGMVCDTGDSADLSFRDCRFVGTTSWSAWPRKPGVLFERCTFVGAISNAFGDSDMRRATRFRNCDFRDDPRLSDRGLVYLNGDTGPIADLSTARNMLFEGCRFRLTHRGALPWSTGAIYQNCQMSQRSPDASYPRGVFRGQNEISGSAILTGSRNEGRIVLNGRLLPSGTI